MVIQYEDVKVPVTEARRTGRPYRREYYLCHGNRRVGPYRNLLDARLALRRTEEAVRQRRVRTVAALPPEVG